MQHDTGFGLGTNEVKRRHILPKALLVGLVAGLLASGFRVALLTAERARIALLADLPAIQRLPLALAIGMVGGGSDCGWCDGTHRTQAEVAFRSLKDLFLVNAESSGADFCR